MCKHSEIVRAGRRRRQCPCLQRCRVLKYSIRNVFIRLPTYIILSVTSHMMTCQVSCDSQMSCSNLSYKMLHLLMIFDLPKKGLKFSNIGFWVYGVRFPIEDIPSYSISRFDSNMTTLRIALKNVSWWLVWLMAKLWISAMSSWSTKFSKISTFQSFGSPWRKLLIVILIWDTKTLGYDGLTWVVRIKGSSHDLVTRMHLMSNFQRQQWSPRWKLVHE